MPLKSVSNNQWWIRKCKLRALTVSCTDWSTRLQRAVKRWEAWSWRDVVWGSPGGCQWWKWGLWRSLYIRHQDVSGRGRCRRDAELLHDALALLLQLLSADHLLKGAELLLLALALLQLGLSLSLGLQLPLLGRFPSLGLILCSLPGFTHSSIHTFELVCRCNLRKSCP